MGYSLFSYKLNDSEFTSRLPIIFYEPGINVKYKFYTWLGVGATIGYRVALKTNRYLSGKLNSPLYSGGILIYWDQLAVAIFKKSKIVQKWLGPEEW